MNDLNVRLRELESKVQLRELVDCQAYLTDRKDVIMQLRLFTDDATVEMLTTGNPVMKGKESRQLREDFAAFVTPLASIHHFNGQHTISVSGAQAAGTLHCFITMDRGYYCKRLRTSMSVIYEDGYRHVDRRWLIARRKLTIVWQESHEVI